MTKPTPPKRTDPAADTADAAFADRDTNPPAVLARLSALAAQGSSRAPVLLGWMYQEGLGVAQDLKEAERQYQAASALGCSQGDYYLGYLYRHQGAQTEAHSAFARGAARGDAECQEALQSVLDAEYDALVQAAAALQSSQPARAFAEFRFLVERGAVQAMLYLGRACRLGLGTAPDPAQAQAWYERALAVGSVWVRGEAALGLGLLHLAHDRPAQARQAFTEGAALGHPACQYHLALLWQQGRGGPPDIRRALHLFEQASAQGHLLAAANQARQLISGRFGIRQILRGIRLLARTLVEGLPLAWKDPDSDRFH